MDLVDLTVIGKSLGVISHFEKDFGLLLLFLEFRQTLDRTFNFI